MAKLQFNLQVLSDVSWWHWLATIPLLAGSLAGQPGGLIAAMILCALAAAYFYYHLREVRPYPVQVRLAYLGLLAVGILPAMQWVHWVQLAGTTAMVTVGYCPLNRMLTLLPMNRDQPLTLSCFWQALVSEPFPGGLWKRASQTAGDPVACCSLTQRRASESCSPSNSVKSLRLQEKPHAAIY